jgi:hypothetical protein
VRTASLDQWLPPTSEAARDEHHRASERQPRPTDSRVPCPWFPPRGALEGHILPRCVSRLDVTGERSSVPKRPATLRTLARTAGPSPTSWLIPVLPGAPAVVGKPLLAHLRDRTEKPLGAASAPEWKSPRVAPCPERRPTRPQLGDDLECVNKHRSAPLGRTVRKLWPRPTSDSGSRGVRLNRPDASIVSSSTK